MAPQIKTGLTNVTCCDCGETMTEKQVDWFLGLMFEVQTVDGKLEGLCAGCMEIRHTEGDDPDDTLCQFV